MFEADMRRAFIAFMAALVLLFAATYAGMAVFGMGAVGAVMADMDAAVGHCPGMDCHGAPESPAAGLDCVEHCLAAIPAAAAASPISLVPAFVATLIVVVLSERKGVMEHAGRTGHRWREGIGKLRLHGDIAFVALRN